MSKEEKIRRALDEQLTDSNQERYADLLINRIEENRKSLSKLFFTLILCVFAFLMFSESKISEISLGPFKLTDSTIAIALLPSVFAFLYYKYLTIWVDLVEQKMTYKLLTAKLFSIDHKSFLNQKLRPYSFLDSIYNNEEDYKSILGCITMGILLPIGLLITFSAFAFIFYTVYTLYHKFGLDSIHKKVIFLLPVLLGLFAVLTIIQAFKRDSNNKRYYLKHKV